MIHFLHETHPLYNDCEDLNGPVALIKSGQALSLQPDLLKNKIWATKLGKLVDVVVGSFSDMDAMKTMKQELRDLPTLRNGGSVGRKPSALSLSLSSSQRRKKQRLSKIEKMTASDPISSLFEFSNSNLAVASASIGQVYKARINRGPALEAAIGRTEAAKFGGKTVAIKIQRLSNRCRSCG